MGFEPVRRSVKVVVPDAADEAFSLRRKIKRSIYSLLLLLFELLCFCVESHLHVLLHLLLLVSQLPKGIDDQT